MSGLECQRTQLHLGHSIHVGQLGPFLLLNRSGVSACRAKQESSPESDPEKILLHCGPTRCFWAMFGSMEVNKRKKVMSQVAAVHGRMEGPYETQ